MLRLFPRHYGVSPNDSAFDARLRSLTESLGKIVVRRFVAGEADMCGGHMDWEKAANIATVVEAIVVAVSIIFIWKQLRQQTKLTRIANTQALVDISSPFNLELIKDPKMAALWVRGSKD
jgi:hypothetical protein